MKISELILKLEEIKSTEGDIPVCISDVDSYYGRSYETIDEDSINIKNVVIDNSKYRDQTKVVSLEY